jgi:quercetin dioxygenase-like cupin family protein
MGRFDCFFSRVPLAMCIGGVALVIWCVDGKAVWLHAAQGNFIGGGPVRMDSEDVLKARVRLDAGARSSWHSHSWGQLLLVEEGRGRIQLRGEGLREMRPGEPVLTGAGIVHWHGAAPDESMVMLSFRGPDVEWFEPVADDVYLAVPTL